MLLKNHLIEVFKKASSENNILLKENIVLKWVHRFGIDSLNDLLIHSPAQRENHEEENQEQITLIDENHEEENQEQITLIDENHEEENQEQIILEALKTIENSDKKNWKSYSLETSSSNGTFNKKQNPDKNKKHYSTQNLPLPYIRNLRKWIKNDKKAS